MREQVAWQRLDEDAVVGPDEVQARVFADDDLAATHLLRVEGRDVCGALGCHYVEMLCHGVESGSVQVGDEVGGQGGSVVELDAWVRGDVVDVVVFAAADVGFSGFVASRVEEVVERGVELVCLGEGALRENWDRHPGHL